MKSNSRCLLYLMAFFSLISPCHGQAGVISVVGTGMGILDGLNSLFSKEEHKMTDITPLGLHFDMIDDNSYCQLLEGIKMSDSKDAVTEILESVFEDAGKKKNQVLTGLRHAKKNHVKIHKFKFEKGKGGSTVFGFIATKRKENEFDMALCLETMKFKLSPRRILNEVKKESLFSSSESQYITFEEVSLSEKQKKKLEEYLFSRSANRFVNNFRYELDFNKKDQPMFSYCESDKDGSC